MMNLNIFVFLTTATLASAGYSSYDYGSYSPNHHNSWTGHHYSSAHSYDPAPLDYDGHVVDTPEVAFAKAGHLAAHAAAKHAAKTSGPSKWGNSHDAYSPVTHTSFAAPEHHHASFSPNYEHEYVQNKWHGPPAHIELTHDGEFIKDTPEVAKAKVDHFAAVAEIVAHHSSIEHDHDYDHDHDHDHDYDHDYDYHYSPSFGSHSSSYHHSSFY